MSGLHLEVKGGKLVMPDMQGEAARDPNFQRLAKSLNDKGNAHIDITGCNEDRYAYINPQPVTKKKIAEAIIEAGAAFGMRPTGFDVHHSGGGGQ